MKIAIESQRIFRSRKHGMDVVAIELIRQIQKIDFTNEYMLFAKEGEDKHCITPTNNFAIHNIKGFTYGDWEQLSLPAVVNKHKADLLHCTANTGPLYCPVPLVLTLHDIIFLRETNFKGTAYQNFGNIYRRMIVPRVMHKAKVVITVSEHEKEVITSTCKIDPAKIHVIHNAVDERFRKEYGKEQIELFRKSYRLPAQFILHLGNTAPKKNTQRLINSYVEYVDRDKHALPLVLADYPQHLVYSRLEQLGRKDVAAKIFLPGYIPSSQMPLLYKCCTVFVYPSLLESFGLPVLEAMASGKPVITSDIPALREVAGDAAMFIQPEDSSSISGALSGMLESTETYNRYVDFGRERVKLFSWKTSAEKLLSVYSNALK